MPAPLVLVAAGGLAREVAEAVALDPSLDLLGGVDDDPATWGKRVGTVEVLGGIELVVEEHEDARLVVCAGRGASRRAIAARLAALGVGAERYATVVHPSVHVPPSCSVGHGSVLLAQVALTADVTVGRHVVVMPHGTLTHDDVVEDCATLAAGAVLGGHVRIGRSAYVGMGACVREHLTVGAGAVVGMGAAVTRDVPDGETWVGVPAAPLHGLGKRVPA